MKTRKEVITEAENVVAMVYGLQTIRLHKPESWTISMQDNLDRWLIRLETLNWVLGPDKVEL